LIYYQKELPDAFVGLQTCSLPQYMVSEEISGHLPVSSIKLVWIKHETKLG